MGSRSASVLVVGASGLVGRRLMRRLGDAACGTYSTHAAPELVHLDVTDAAEARYVVERAQPRVVIDCAAWTHVDGCEKDPARSYAVNVEGVRNLAVAAAAAGARFIFYSTDYVFGGDTGPHRLDEALLNGLSADPSGFVGPTRARMPVADAERQEIRDRFDARRSELANRFDALLPNAQTYSPLSFFFNFCQNVIKGAVADAVLWGTPSSVSVNDLLSGLPADGRSGLDEERRALARTLNGYARSNPHRIRGRLMPVIEATGFKK